MKSGTCIYFKGGNTLSLFDKGSCCGDSAPAAKPISGIAALLDSLANGTNGSLCSIAQPAVIRVIHRGTEEPIDVTGNEFGTDFTLLRFDRKTGLVALSYTEGVAPAIITRTVVLDVRAIAGIVCVNTAANGM
jgi:hypothetical protein